MKSLRQQISFVLQDTLLFHATIWENIAYGRPEANRAEIIEAAKLANAHEFIEKMPEGYDTMVGERGVTLSGGQRQRIAIARAVIRNTPILILDEPTSGLDAASEQAVFEALERLMKGKTSIVIAHHLATIRRADIIFVVKDNTLVERGTHAELLAAGGVYAELYEIQFRQEESRTGGLPTLQEPGVVVGTLIRRKPAVSGGNRPTIFSNPLQLLQRLRCAASRNPGIAFHLGGREAGGAEAVADLRGGIPAQQVAQPARIRDGNVRGDALHPRTEAVVGK